MRVNQLTSGWLPRTLGLLALVVAGANGYAADPTGASDPANGKHYTKEPVFHLPISINERMRNNIKEVQLYMKLGQSEWQCKESAAPSQKAFTFRALTDGEYWFTLVTVDHKGTRMPADLTKLTNNEIVMVVVDTQPPSFDLQPMKMANGEVQLRCVVNDANPDPATVRIAYRTSDQGMRNLEPVAGMPLTFQVPSAEALSSPLHVMMSDLAGNSTSSDVNLQEIASKLWPAPIVPVVAASPVNPPTVPVVQAAPVNLPATPVVQSVTSNSPNVGAGLPIIPPINPPSNVGGSSTRDLTVGVSPGNVGGSPSAVGGMPMISGTIQRQFINTSRASLDYRIDQVGPSGVGKVEVWLTSDQGGTWKRLCEDADRRSPAEFELPGDGLYGVRVAVTNGNGFGGRTPTPGEQPQIWIEVDTTPPSVQLKEVEPSTNGGSIDLRWLASDKNLGSEPINLYYATRHEGPWQPLARGLKNDGLYRWTFPRDMGSQFFVRLEAIDLAGNIARCETPNAIVLDMTEPKASVVGVTGVRQ
jgi:hypothetical protein